MATDKKLSMKPLMDLSKDLEPNRIGNCPDASRILKLTEEFYWPYGHQKVYKKIGWAEGFVTLVAVSQSQCEGK